MSMKSSGIVTNQVSELSKKELMNAAYIISFVCEVAGFHMLSLLR